MILKRMFALAALCAAMAAPPLLAGCSAIQVGTAIAGAPSTESKVAVAAAENAFTSAVRLETVWLQSGKATAAQARTAKALREAVYSNIVAARTAAANNDNPGVAVALKLFNQALPVFAGYVANGGAP
jgi:hypothetical protein